MKTNVIQTIVLALVGFALICTGALFIMSVAGEPEPGYTEHAEELFGWFSWFAILFDNILRGLAGFAIAWLGYKVWPFHDDKQETAALEEPDEQEQIETHLISIGNE